MRGRTVLAAVVALAVVAGLAGFAGYALGRGDRAGGPVPPAAEGPGDADLVLASALQPFDDCDGLLAWYRDNALEQVGPYGLDGGYGTAVSGAAASTDAAVGRAGAAAEEGLTAEAAAPADAAAPVGPSATGTNVQEAGVDEPDVVKTDGERAFVAAAGALQVVDVGDGDPRVVGSVDLPDGDHELLLDGDRVLVLGRRYGAVVPFALEERSAPAAQGPVSVLTLVDVADPAAPAILRSVELDGDYRSARLADGTVRIVVDTPPTALPFVAPEVGGLRAEREATQRNREVVRAATLEDWLPWAVTTDADGRTVDEGPLLDCDQVRRPPAFAGLSTLSVLSVDLAAGLELGGGTGVVARGETVYASPDTLYVGTTTWDPEGRAATSTDLHAFDLSDPRAAPYRGSGSVAGRLLNQYALSEHEGHLRVAVTEEGDGDEPSQSAVVVLAAEGGQLVEVGRAGGLGLTETIRSVRFLGDLGVVVTFRQTDPLYTLDLSDPRDPRVAGELKITGYSAYLHPVGDGRLLGVGQDATEDGTITGVQASLFDVSDPAAPARLDQVTFGQGSAAVEWDPRAFLYWPDTALAVVPVELWSPPTEQAPPGREPVEELPIGQGFAGAVGLRVTGDGLEETARISHDPVAAPGSAPAPGSSPALGSPADPIRRALVVGDVLYTVGSASIRAADLDDLEPRGLAAFE